MVRQITKMFCFCYLSIILVLTAYAGVLAQEDPLPSWSESKSKSSIADFVAKVTIESSPGLSRSIITAMV